jgi:hypothetical protein
VKNESNLWSLARWARNKGVTRNSCTPTIRTANWHMAQDTVGKAAAFQAAFFPKPPEADLSDIEGFHYLEPKEFPRITEHEVREAIRSAPPDKAPGEDQLPNSVLKLASEALIPLITRVFNRSIDIGYCPAAFKRSVTVVLRKPDPK